MRKSSIIIILILLIGTFSSCTRIILAAYGAHMPRQENKLDLLNFLNKKKMRVDNVLFLKTEKDWLNFAKYGVDLICFDRNHNYYMYKDTSQCNSPAFMYCENICKSEIPLERINSAFRLDSILSITEDISGNTPMISNADYTVFIGWAKWNGRLNGDHVKVWEDALGKSGCNVKIYKLCFDPLKEWGAVGYNVSNKMISKRRNKKGEVIN